MWTALQKVNRAGGQSNTRGPTTCFLLNRSHPLPPAQGKVKAQEAELKDLACRQAGSGLTS